MTYWERLQRSATRDASLVLDAINAIDVYYFHRAGTLCCHSIDGAAQAVQFLSTHASFADVQQSQGLPATIDHISCIHVIRRSP
jgi:hypothetical protein